MHTPKLFLNLNPAAFSSMGPKRQTGRTIPVVERGRHTEQQTDFIRQWERAMEPVFSFDALKQDAKKRPHMNGLA